MYRRLEDGRLEFISFCDERTAKWLSIYGPEFQGYLDALLPEYPENAQN